MRSTFMLLLLLGLSVTGDGLARADTAPAHIVTEDQIDAALCSPGAVRQQQEQRIHALLERPEMRELAGTAGLDLVRAHAAVATLSDDELAQLSDNATQLEEALAGGDSIVISPYMLIIALLVLIIILVA